MSTIPVHIIVGNTAVKIAESVENAIREGFLQRGDRLPSVRELARQLEVANATVAAAYQALQSRGLVLSQGRRGTKVSFRPLSRICRPEVKAGQAHDLSNGNPDLAFLPDMQTVLTAIDPSPRLYGQPPNDPELEQIVAADLKRCGVAYGPIAFVNGAMDGMDRVLSAALRPGDRVAVEDPSFGNVLDLVTSRDMTLVPIRVDREGVRPEELARACKEGVKAVIVTPRVQNPTGAVISEARAEALRDILDAHPNVLVMEDDHAAYMTDAPLHPIHRERSRWIYVRSFSKAINPDLRLAAMTGDEATMTQVLDRMLLGERWVSHILQRIAAAFLSNGEYRIRLVEIARVYASRREGLKAALARWGIEALGDSGYNLWIPVAAETPTVQALFQAGWLVAPGERFRIHGPPAIRITCATLEEDEAEKLAEELARILQSAPRRTGA